MIAVNLDRVSVTYVSEPIFEDLSWEVHDDRVVGLVGPNGCGKSTLLRLISGELTSDTGFTIRRKELTVYWSRRSRDNLEEGIELATDGHIPLSELPLREYSLDQTQEAMEDTLRRPGDMLRAVVLP